MKQELPCTQPDSEWLEMPKDVRDAIRKNPAPRTQRTPRRGQRQSSQRRPPRRR